MTKIVVSIANVKDLCNVNISLNVNINVTINGYSFKYICLVCYLKLRFTQSLSHRFCSVLFEFSWFRNTEQWSETLILTIEMLLEFQKKTNIEIIEFKLNHYGFALVLSDIDLENINLLDTHLYLLIQIFPVNHLFL